MMFGIGNKVAIKYSPPLYMKGCIEYTYPIGVITHDFGNNVYRVRLSGGDEYVFNSEQLDVVIRASEMNKEFNKEMSSID